MILFDAKFKGLMDRIKPGIKVLAYTVLFQLAFYFGRGAMRKVWCKWLFSLSLSVLKIRIWIERKLYSCRWLDGINPDLWTCKCWERAKGPLFRLRKSNVSWWLFAFLLCNSNFTSNSFELWKRRRLGKQFRTSDTIVSHEPSKYRSQQKGRLTSWGSF